MDYIFKEWQKQLEAMQQSVEKDLKEIRKCKDEIQQMKLDTVAELKKGRYIRDDQRLVLSAPEVIIGNIDGNGNLFAGGSTIVVRGTDVSLQGAGEGGKVEMRAPAIRQTAEDPGIDGLEHVVGSISTVSTQARNIIIQSNDSKGAFSMPPVPTGDSGVRIHADRNIDLHAAMTAESREKSLEAIIKTTEKQKEDLKKQVDAHSNSFRDLTKEIEQLLDNREKLLEDNDSVRTNYEDIRELSVQIEAISMSITEEAYAFSRTLSMLAETNRLMKCYKDEKSKIVKGDDFKKKPTGARVNVTGETISLTSADGEGNLRDNPGAGITMWANQTSISATEKDGKLKEKGKVSVTAKYIDVATAGADGVEIGDGGVPTAATFAAEGDFTLRSKNITFESTDYEIADKKLKEKQLTADSKIKLRAKTIEVSTEGSANVDVDDKGKLTKANMTAEGDIIVTSKTFTLNSTDTDIEDGKPKEKALTSGGSVTIRAEKMDLSATDTEGKATGSVNINAKAVGLKAMDVEKEKRTDDKLADGSTMTIVAEKMYVGAKSKNVKSKKVQVMSDEIGAFADKTLEIQQNDGKAIVQLSGGNTSIAGGKTQIYGETTINAKTEVKDELKAPKATIDNVEAKTSLKSPNVSDGIPVPAAPATASLSAKLKTEDVK